MKLPRRLFAIAMLAFAMLLFSAMSSPPVSAADDSSAPAQVDRSGTVGVTNVNEAVSPIEYQAGADCVGEAVGRMLLNATVRTFEPVKELAGYRQKVATKPKESTYNGMGNTRAREQV